MNIHFSPISMLASYSLEVAGDSIVIDGVRHSLADLAEQSESGTLPPFVASATAEGVTLLLPYWGKGSDSVLYPEPLMAVPDGVVELPR